MWSGTYKNKNLYHVVYHTGIYSSTSHPSLSYSAFNDNLEETFNDDTLCTDCIAP